MAEEPGPVDRLAPLLAEWRALGHDPRSSELVALLSYASAAMRTGPDAVLAAHGLTHELFDVLAALYRAGHPEGLTQAELAGRMLVSQAGMLKRLRRLEEMGLVSRHAHPADRRKHLVALTPSGARTIDDVVGPFLAAQDACAAALSPAEQLELVRLLGILVDGNA